MKLMLIALGAVAMVTAPVIAITSCSKEETDHNAPVVHGGSVKGITYFYKKFGNECILVIKAKEKWQASIGVGLTSQTVSMNYCE